MSDNVNRLLPNPGEIKIRLYRQGLGDCFLLAFPRKDRPERPFYLVIDCGVAMSTPDKGGRINKVVANLREATDGHIDALAITHQHYDHISGFLDAWQEWKKIKVDALYLPWTEATEAKGEYAGKADFQSILNRAAQKALEMWGQADTLNAYPGFRAEADFLGVDLTAAGKDTPKIKGPANMEEAMEFVRTLCPADKIRYFKPGDGFTLPGTESHAYVLGPPLSDTEKEKGKKYIEILSDGTEGVMYSY